MKRETPWAVEAQMCDAFMVAAREAGWTCYPETGAWDILLVGPDGFQCGVQAKLRSNLHVVAQALDGLMRGRQSGPDVRAVLLPWHDSDMQEVCHSTGIAYFWAEPWSYRRHSPRETDRGVIWNLRAPGDFPDHLIRHRDPALRHWLPPVVPGGQAGCPAPMTLTPWKVKAIRLCLRLRARGYVTTRDFKDLDLNPTTWMHQGWLLALGDRDGRHQKLTANPQHRLFDELHPEIAAGLTEVAHG